MRKQFAILFVCCCTLLVNAQRLPGNVVPVHYQLQLDPDLATGVLAGDETIDVRVLSATNTIVLNAVDLKLSNAKVTVGEPMNAEVSYDPKQEMVTLQLPKSIQPGTAKIHFQFSGKVRNDLRGLYFSKTARRNYIATQFEGTYARMAFPCFDEPAHKATFDISVVADSGDTAISNGKILDVKEGPTAGKHEIRFATSPKMSSYLVALAVGDFKCQEGSADDIPIRICAVPEKAELGKFALRSAEAFMKYYNRYYSIKYPFAKLDMVAFPDYEWGGMENTASVFYKERALLIDEKTASVGAKRGVAGVVAHEMAHQWFGDLVTMKWWDNIWLNEGFATWMTPHALQDWDPSWDQSVEEVGQAGFVMAEDSLESTRAIHAKAETPDEIKEMFDGVAYGKGAIVLRMLESYVGAEAFRAGTNAYLTKYANGNATAEDFWSTLANASNKPVEKIMSSYVNQPGTPLVSVASACKGDHTQLTVSQSRFYSSAKRLQAPSPELWAIPVCIHGSSGDAQCKLLTQHSEPMTFPGCQQWVVGNVGGRGVYLTAYDPELLRRLAKAAASLPPAERVALVSNQWTLTRVGRVDVADFLQLASSLSNDKNSVVLSTVLAAMRQAGDQLAGSDLTRYKTWVRAQIAPRYQEVNSDPALTATDDGKALRAMLFSTMAWTDDASTLQHAAELAKQYRESPATVDPTLAGTAVNTAARSGGEELYRQYKDKLAKSKSPQEHSTYLFALSTFRKPELVRQNMELLKSPEMRTQDVAGFLSAMLSNPSSRDEAWAYMKANWPTLQKTAVSFGGGGAVGALGSFCDADHRQEIFQFFAQNPAPGAERTVKKTLENIDNCIAFRDRQQGSFRSWMKSTGEQTSASK